MNKEKEEKLAEISVRITQLIEYISETPNSFATKLGYSRAQTIYDILKMKSAPSYDFFQRFANSEFSVTISLNWLLTGKGAMLCDNQNQEENKSNLESTISSSAVSPDTVTLRLIDKLDEKDNIIKEKEAKIEQLQFELRAMGEELASFKTKYSEDNIELRKGLDHAKGASTKKPSSPNADNATSAPAR